MAIGAGGIEVAEARMVRRIQHLMGLAFHGLDGAISAEVLRMAEGDVPGASESGESEAQGRHGGPEGPEGAWHGLLPT